ncbi:ABC transporter ATP-binding protein [uncultured Roseibium sp.]|uniref:ABC transporter ATP-binding protein n=1 Tax=uncultured Roseibium sp. TaxID=1936171 RepID=UPI003217A787
MSNAILTVDNLTIGFGRSAEQSPAVKGLSYFLKANETLAIVGESGSGKSVSSMALLGLLPKGTSRILSGTAEFDGRDLLQLGEEDQREIRGKRISMIFQEPMTSLNPVLTIGRQMTEVVLAHDPKYPGVEKSAVTMLDRVGLPDPSGMMKRYPHQLSGGQRQRVMIAMALINPAGDPDRGRTDDGPRRDRPGADPGTDARTQGPVRHEHAARLPTTMASWRETADRVIVMKQGEKVEERDVGPLFASPEHPYTRKLLAAVPKIGSSDVACKGRGFICRPCRSGRGSRAT